VPSIPNKIFGKINEGKLEYVISGDQQPTVIFINGGGPANMDSWGKIYPQIEKISRVFAYNRFGDGNSDQVDESQSGEKIVAALKQLLQHAGEKGPYILVGHSIGGLYAILLARLYPQDVIGVVLVDSAHPDQGKMMHEQGILNNLILKIYAKFNPTKSSELNSFDETVSQIKNAGAFPDVPLLVISAGKRSSFFVPDETIKIIEKHQKELVELSTQGKQIVAKKSGHFIQNSEPEIVVNAIMEIINQTRK